MKQLNALFLILLLAACKKSGKDEPYIATCPDPGGFNWVSAKSHEFSSCTCKVNFVYGVYNNEPVIEIRIVDPLCNGINIVYKQDGTELLSSTDQEAYQKYLDEVKDTRVIWTCEKPGKS